MKNLYTLGKAGLAACLLVFGASSVDVNAQSVESKALVNTGQPNMPILNESEVLFEQPRSTETGGIVTGDFEGLGTSVYSADDFVLEDPATITRLSSTGFQNLQTFTDLVFLGQTYYVYADDNGAPAGSPAEDGSEVFSFSLEDGDDGLEVVTDGSSYTIVMDLEAIDETFFLSAGTYWIVSAPNHDMEDLDGDTRWNWAQGEQTGGEPLLIDPDDNFGAGATDWTAFSTLGVEWDPAGLTFVVEGIPGEQEDPELGAFALLSPTDGTAITVEEGSEDPVTVEWEVSDNAESYTWLVNAAGAGFDEPLVELPADNDGAANTLSLTTGAIYDVLVGLGFEDGDTAELEWTVEAAAGEATLLADAPFSIDITLQGEATSTEPISNLPQDFNLEQNYPNPFNPTTSIEFSVPEASDVTLEVFNMQGQRVATLVNGTMSAGSHRASFDAANLSSGIYLYRMTAGNFTATNKMMLVK